jgi:hypothetical protein
MILNQNLSKIHLMFTYVGSLEWELDSRVNIVSSEYSQQAIGPEPTGRGFQT